MYRNFSICLSLFAVTLAPQVEAQAKLSEQFAEQLGMFDDMILRNVWRNFFGYLWGPAVKTLCGLELWNQEMLLNILIPIFADFGPTTDDARAIFASKKDTMLATCEATAAKVGKQIWHTVGRKVYLYGNFDEFSYTPGN